jgi:hypothetical protein
MGDNAEMSAAEWLAYLLFRRSGRSRCGGAKPKQAACEDRRAAKKRQRVARRKGSR